MNMRKRMPNSPPTKGRGGRRPSFLDTDTGYINAEVPAELLKSFRVLVATRNSRLNRELAAAMELYIKKTQVRQS